jgi:putative selenate reductase
MLRELELKDAVFDLPRRVFFAGDPRKDLSVRFHGATASSALGPAAGPHTQMAQNIVSAWLGGARVFELKTVQILDRLKIPRPCIDMRNVGYNVEWSQELRTEESLEEYVKASMLIEILQASGKIPSESSFGQHVFDMSVGYDLQGVSSDKVRAFIAGMKDAREVVERLRTQIPAAYKQYRDLPFQTALSHSVTLSTFHGCPPHEIEGIATFVMEELGLDCIVKLNPTLLGPEELRSLLWDTLGFTDIRVPDDAFEKDANWEQVSGFVVRLDEKARRLGRGFGVKFTNTLVVENRGDFLPASEKTMYLSGAPLHVLAMNLVRRFRRHFGARIPVSFAGGIDKRNFPDAVSLGLVPVTVCSDLLTPGGYGRLRGYAEELVKRMDAAGASNISEFILKARGYAGEVVEDAILFNTESYVQTATGDPRYAKAKNTGLPKKVGSHLVLFDCLTCDKCVPVCPNDANFTYAVPRGEIPIVNLWRDAAGWQSRAEGTLSLDKKHQIANFADFCNECGNCDVFCPEDGGPYVVKPRFFGSRAAWEQTKHQDGFFLERAGGVESVYGRFSGREYAVSVSPGMAEYSGAGFRVRFQEGDPVGTIAGDAAGDVDLTYFHIMNLMRRGLFAADAVNYVNAEN